MTGAIYILGAIYVPLWVIPAIFVGFIAVWWAWDDRRKIIAWLRSAPPERRRERW